MNERWYDYHKRLRGHLDSFKDMKESLRDPLIKGIMEIIHHENPDLLSSEAAFNFPLELNRRRWYDRDPYLWLLFNTLQSGEKPLHDKVADFLDKKTPKS